jgi:hypothetical protein
MLIYSQLPRFEVLLRLRHSILYKLPENFDMATGVSLPDQYVLLLQNVVEENRAHQRTNG